MENGLNINAFIVEVCFIHNMKIYLESDQWSYQSVIDNVSISVIDQSVWLQNLLFGLQWVNIRFKNTNISNLGLKDLSLLHLNKIIWPFITF